MMGTRTVGSMTEQAFHRSLRLAALAAWLVSALTAVGSLPVDPETRFELAERIVEHGTIAFPERGIHTVEHDGRHFSVFFPGQSIVFLPAAAGGAIAKRLGVGADLAANAARFFASTVLMTAFVPLCLLGHVVLLRGLGVGRRVALFSGAMSVLGTSLWVFGGNSSEEVTLGALATWAFWALVDARRVAGDDAPETVRARAFARRMGLAGVLLALGLLHRSTFVTVTAGAAVFAVPLLIRQRHLVRRAAGRFAVWIAAAAAIVAIVPLYNWARFGDPFDTGYPTYYVELDGLFENPILDGLRGHLLSPGKSLFVYVPWLLLLVPALLKRRVRQRLGLFGIALGVAFAAHLLVYSAYTYWSGAFGWFVRFHTSFMPLLTVPIALWLDGQAWRLPGRIAVGLVALASITVQLAGNAFNEGLEHRQHREDYTGYRELIPVEAAWTWQRSQLVLRFENIVNKLRGRPLLDIPPDDPQRILTVWNIFPARAAVVMHQRWLVTVLWVLWSALGLGALAATGRAIHWWRRLPRGPDPSPA